MHFGILLGRLLTPEDYSMMTMIAVFSQIAAILQSSGFTAALVNLKNPTHEDYNSVFWFNIFAGLFLYTVLFFCAPLIAAYYRYPELLWFCRYAFLGFLFANIGTAQGAWLQKNLRVKEQAKASIAAVVVSSCVGVTMAWMGFAYWALATQSIVYILTVALLRWHYSAWRPSMHIDFTPVKRMFPFSVKILGAGIVDAININVLNILLGHYFSPRDTGNYNQAYQWNTKCYSLVQSMVAQVAQPVLVSLGNEPGRQTDVFRKMMRFTAFIAFPLLLGFGLVAKEFIVLAIGEKWLASAALIQILCVAGATMPIATLFSNMIISKGRSGTFFWCTFSLGVVQIGVMMMLWRQGITRMVEAYTALNVVWLGVWLFFVRRLTGYGLRMFLRDVMPFALAAAAVMSAVHYATLSISNLWLLLGTRFVLAVALYYAVMKVARVKILAECEAFVRRKRG